MCGNEISSVSNPNGDFYQLVSTQVPSRKIIVSTSLSMQRTTPSQPTILFS